MNAGTPRRSSSPVPPGPRKAASVDRAPDLAARGRQRFALGLPDELFEAILERDATLLGARLADHAEADAGDGDSELAHSQICIEVSDRVA